MRCQLSSRNWQTCIKSFSKFDVCCVLVVSQEGGVYCSRPISWLWLVKWVISGKSDRSPLNWLSTTLVIVGTCLSYHCEPGLSSMQWELKFKTYFSENMVFWSSDWWSFGRTRDRNIFCGCTPDGSSQLDNVTRVCLKVLSQEETHFSPFLNSFTYWRNKLW